MSEGTQLYGMGEPVPVWEIELRRVRHDLTSLVDWLKRHEAVLDAHKADFKLLNAVMARVDENLTSVVEELRKERERVHP